MKVEQLENIIDRMLMGKYTGYKISFVTDRIAWMYKWKKIDDNTKDRLCEKIIEVIKNNG